MEDLLIQKVSDTAIWVANFRAQEGLRPDALFHDPLAGVLSGEKGIAITKQMTATRYTGWAVAIRTKVIDDFIQELLSLGVDTVLNIGAGLDTRPYRMKLPHSLRWIEVDVPEIIELKESRLKNEKPNCHLERVKMDLSNVGERALFFKKINSESKKVLILTEGVMPYLTNEAVASFAREIASHDHFRYWIVDYFAPHVIRHMQSAKRKAQMKNAPFQFMPEEWFGFFKNQGWKPRTEKYLGEESLKLGREIPAEWWVKIIVALTPKKKRATFLKSAGYFIMERTS